MAASGAEYVVTIQISIVTTFEPDTNYLYWFGLIIMR